MRGIFLYAMVTALVMMSLPDTAVARRLVEKMPAVSAVAEGYYDRDSVERRMRSLDLHHVEGIWEFPSDGTVVAIEREAHDIGDGATSYLMVVIYSANRAIRPGTVMGRLAPTSQRHVYAAHLYTSDNGGGVLVNPKDFTVRLEDDGYLSLRKHQSTLRSSWWRMLPYISRLGVRVYRDEGRKDLDGCRRVFPKPLSTPAEPIYL